MSLTALQLRLTQFEHRLLKRELLLEVGQEILHLAIIIIIFYAEMWRAVKTRSAFSIQKLIFHNIVKSALENSLKNSLVI